MATGNPARQLRYRLNWTGKDDDDDKFADGVGVVKARN
jgi:hypothetical protein